MEKSLKKKKVFSYIIFPTPFVLIKNCKGKKKQGKTNQHVNMQIANLLTITTLKVYAMPKKYRRGHL